MRLVQAHRFVVALYTAVQTLPSIDLIMVSLTWLRFSPRLVYTRYHVLLILITGETLVNLEQLDDGRVRYFEGDNTGEPSHEGGVVRACVRRGVLAVGTAGDIDGSCSLTAHPSICFVMYRIW